MGVPFEALLPYGIIVAMFGVTGAGLTAIKHFSNDGKKARWNRDLWDRVWLIYWFIANDGERFENYGEYKRPVRQCCGSKGLRSQQSVEGKIDWLSFGREKGGY